MWTSKVHVGVGVVVVLAMVSVDIGLDSCILIWMLRPSMEVNMGVDTVVCAIRLVCVDLFPDLNVVIDVGTNLDIVFAMGLDVDVDVDGKDYAIVLLP